MNSGYPPEFLALQILQQLSNKVLGSTAAFFKAIFLLKVLALGLGISVQVILTTVTYMKAF